MNKKAAIMLVFLILGCTSESDDQQKTIKYTSYSDGQLSLEYPGWANLSDPGSLVSVSNGVCSFYLRQSSGDARLEAEKEGCVWTDDYALRNFSIQNLEAEEEIINCRKMYRARFICPDLDLASGTIRYVFGSIECKNPDDPAALEIPQEIDELQFRHVKTGVVPNPSPGASPEESIEQARYAGKMISYAAGWSGMSGSGLASELQNYYPLYDYYGLTPIVSMNFWKINEDLSLGLIGAEGKDLSDPDFRADYKEEALKIARIYRPPYFALGIEVNTYYDLEPLDFENFISLYRETYDEIKRVSPETKVFVTFAYSQMIGSEEEGITSGPQWELLDKFGDKLDLLAFTSNYPRFDSVESIPDNYYSQIKNHTNLPIAFTETCWPSDPALNSSELDQVRFLQLLLNQTKGMDLEFVIWLLEHDLESYDYLTGSSPRIMSVGLRYANGTEKLAWYAMNKIKES